MQNFRIYNIHCDFRGLLREFCRSGEMLPVSVGKVDGFTGDRCHSGESTAVDKCEETRRERAGGDAPPIVGKPSGAGVWIDFPVPGRLEIERKSDIIKIRYTDRAKA